MNVIKNKREWQFILKETHKRFNNNRLQREMLFTMQIELSKIKPNLQFFNELKEKYLKINC
ncbi:MAG: hypothetical protein LBP63_10485 [Prevotellaceae bacterium]|jgi:hypothetical protein|nr:hypothetical protein [Prevotellaceae bacterium]